MKVNLTLDSEPTLYHSDASISNYLKREELVDNELRGTVSGIEYVYFALAGLMSLAIYFIMIGQADDFNIIYPGMNYSFYAVSPQFFAPFCIGISYLIRNIHLRTKILAMIILSSLFFVGIPIIAFFLENDTIGFTLMMACYFTAYMCAMILQGLLVASGSFFPTQGTVVLLTFQPIFNLLMMIVKVIILFFELTIVMDFVFLWSMFLLLAAGIFLSFLKTSQGYRFKKQEEQSSVVTKNHADYRKAIKTIKYELIEVFLTMFLTFLIFPGVFFSLAPAQGMSAKTYINISNLVNAIIELLGKPLGYQDFNKVVARIGHFLGVIIAAFLIYVYMTKDFLEYPGIEYLFFVLTGLTMYRTSIGSTYLFVKTSKKARDGTREPIGVLMTYSLVSGIAAGNLVSLGFPYIREAFF